MIRTGDIKRMTLRELLETGYAVRSITADIRDYREDKGGYLIDCYHIGPDEYEDMFADDTTEPRWKTICRPINTLDTGKDIYGVIIKAIPKQLLEMEVKGWELWSNKKLMVNLAGNDEAVAVIEQSKESLPLNEIDGQMNITDYIGV